MEDDRLTTQPLLGLRGRNTTRLRRATTVGRVVFPIGDVSRRRLTRNFAESKNGAWQRPSASGGCRSRRHAPQLVCHDGNLVAQVLDPIKTRERSRDTAPDGGPQTRSGTHGTLGG